MQTKDKKRLFNIVALFLTGIQSKLANECKENQKKVSSANLIVKKMGSKLLLKLFFNRHCSKDY